MFLYLTTDGLNITKSGGRFIIKNLEIWEKQEQEIPISLVEWIVIFGKIQLSTDTIRECLKWKIPVFFLSKHWNIFGKLDSLEIRNVELLYSHIKASLDHNLCLFYAKSIISSKVRNSKVMLQRRKRFYKRNDIDLQSIYWFLDIMADKVNKSENLEELRWYEWNAARWYFEWFSKFIPFPFTFNWRNRRPPKDPINSMLSLWYTLLAQNIQMILSIHWIDSQIWFFHQPKDLKSLLVLDIMEMFRAWIVDDLVIRLTITWKIQHLHFLINEDDEKRPCLMLDEWLRIFLESYYNTIFKEKWSWELSYMNDFVKLKVIEKNLEEFKQSLVKETHNYEGFKIK